MIACAPDPVVIQGPVGYVEDFRGAVVADEPRAAMAGRDMLARGGTAADAATAAFFALAVTMPASASLGGGGVCIVHDAKTQKTDTLDFLGPDSAIARSAAPSPSAVPANVRGFLALHSTYGRLRWVQMVAPAENLARFGVPVSRALAHDLANSGDVLLAQDEARRIFSRAGGRELLAEGDMLKQVDLAETLARIRQHGGAEFYLGKLARGLATAATRAGGTLSAADLENFTPKWRGTIAVPVSGGTFHFTPPPGAGGAVAAEMWAMLARGGRYMRAPREERLHLLSSVSLRAFADRAKWLRNDGTSDIPHKQLPSTERMERLMATYRKDRHVPADLAAGVRPPGDVAAATSLVAVDRSGSAVACVLTMNAPFGTGRVAKGTGIVLAAPHGTPARGYMPLGAVLALNHESHQFFAAAAASGGAAAPSAMINVLARYLMGRQLLEDALAAKRVHHAAAPDVTYFESGMDADSLESLGRRGHRVAPAPALGLVNAVGCSSGLPSEKEVCSARADPRGYGLAATPDDIEGR